MTNNRNDETARAISEAYAQGPSAADGLALVLEKKAGLSPACAKAAADAVCGVPRTAAGKARAPQIRGTFGKTQAERAQALLGSFRRWAEDHPHASGWIRYEREAIFRQAGLANLPEADKEDLTRILRQDGFLEMRVVGSNEPIPCFRVARTENTDTDGDGIVDKTEDTERC